MKPVFGVTPPPRDRLTQSEPDPTPAPRTERRVDYVIADIVTTPDFDGETYDRERDHDRLSRELGAVRRYISDHKWHTLSEISGALGYPEASVSARLRDLRKDKYGKNTIPKEYVSRGLWRYRMAP